MSTIILSHFPRKDKRMEEPNWESLPIVIIAIAGIIAAVLIYNNIQSIITAEELPEVHATPIYIVEEPSGGHETVEVETVEEISEVAELPVEETKRPTLTDDEIVARVVHQEAKGERLLGQVAVAITVYNRCDYYNKTVESVVFEPNQFSYDPNVKPYDSCFRAVIIAKLIKDFIPDLFPKTMMWFQAGDYHRGNDCGKPYIQIGNHYFNWLPESEE